MSPDRSPDRDHTFHWIWRLVIVVLALAIVAVLGRSIGHDVVAMEAWLGEQGPWGPLVFVLLFIALSSVFVPDTVFAIIAGALFGILWGTILMVGGGVIAATINFFTSRWLLRDHVQAIVAKHPKLEVVQRAATQRGVRLLLLLRLTPISPTVVSYVLGASRVKYRHFLLACVGLVPGFFVEVYFGYVAKHVTVMAGQARTHSLAYNVTVAVGFAICVATFVYIARIAQRELATVEGT